MKDILKNTLLNILDEYLKMKPKPGDKKSPQAVEFIEKTRSTLTTIFKNEPYQVKFSVGQNNWALVPWISFFDKKITTKATKGYYIVYLFKSDMSGIYLSLNQGFTYFKNKYGYNKFKKLSKITNYWREQLNMPQKVSLDDINLNAFSRNTDLPRGYEKGNICSIYYDINELREKSDEALYSDLEDMKLLLRAIRMEILSRGKGVNTFNEEIVRNYTTEYIEQQKHERITAENISLGYKVGIPVKTQFSKYRKDKAKYYKGDYIEQQKRNTRQGRKAEELVAELLKKENSVEVEIRSIQVGDGDGYDILVHGDGKNKKNKYIEVKSTFGDIKAPFYMTSNEIAAAKKYGEQYYIYRLFKENDRWDYYVINDPINGNKLKMEPINWAVLPKNEN